MLLGAVMALMISSVSMARASPDLMVMCPDTATFDFSVYESRALPANIEDIEYRTDATVIVNHEGTPQNAGWVRSDSHGMVSPSGSGVALQGVDIGSV